MPPAQLRLDAGDPLLGSETIGWNMRKSSSRAARALQVGPQPVPPGGGLTQRTGGSGRRSRPAGGSCAARTARSARASSSSTLETRRSRGDQADAGGQLDQPAAVTNDCSTTDRQRGGQPVGVGVVAAGQDGEGAAAHAGDDVLAAHGGTQPAADLGDDACVTTSRPACSRAAARPSSSIMSRVAGALGRSRAGLQRLEDPGPVGQAGHRVGVGDALQGVLAGVPLGHVAAVQDDRADVGVARAGRRRRPPGSATPPRRRAAAGESRPIVGRGVRDRRSSRRAQDVGERRGVVGVHRVQQRAADQLGGGAGPSARSRAGEAQVMCRPWSRMTTASPLERTSDRK